ncbi:class I SAM-dependent methyltransferase [Saccharopolyspora sp. HNM0983]|uniref:Class I SAM-dependent methyltransferase n=1 Tax=Saccharopolyspora montiporae TaxID=2781240 RepID=A0A929B9X4_9PSEU|nr:class I SAM-dependent methyltransferase [Saccharopolyspora sp. HNM0983]MBE9375964.1 class I SAM-dependent methyltransferase [Saccharopolyspora sp. HNM0983]
MAPVRLSAQAETLLITLYSRALDSRSPEPVLGDPAAAEAVHRIDYDFSRLQIGTDEVVGTALRSRPLDAWTRRFLDRHPDAVVLHLGCGLDDRYGRVQPGSGTDWYEIDLPEVIELRCELYGEQGDRKLVAAPATGTAALDAVPEDRPTLVVAEGVLFYLAAREVRELVTALAQRIGRGELVFDAVTPLGKRLIGRGAAVSATGAVLGWALRDPRALPSWHPRLRLLEENRIMTPAARRRMSAPYRRASALPPLRRMVRVLRYGIG